VQPGFLEFVACRSAIPKAIDEMYRQGLTPGQSNSRDSLS